MRFKIEFDERDGRQTEFVDELSRHPSVTRGEHDAVLVVGGDGTMLRALSRHGEPDVFIGIGRGTVNFLMNPTDVVSRLDGLSLQGMSLHPVPHLDVLVDGVAGWQKVGEAYNDVVLGGGVMDWHSFSLTSDNGAFEGYEFRGGGICVSTPIGSTAFNANNGGAILPLDTPALSVTSIIANRDLKEIFDGGVLTVEASSRTEVSVFADGKPVSTLGKSGRVSVRVSQGPHHRIAFEDATAFARKRIELLKAHRK